jgi:chorismate mutase
MAITEHPDTFSAAIALVGLAVDPKACAKRLDELRTAIDKAEAATAKLAVDREQHAAAVAAAKAELEARGAALLKRETALRIAEHRLGEREKAIKDAQPPRFRADPPGPPAAFPLQV